MTRAEHVNPDMALVHHVLDTMPADPAEQSDAEQSFERLYHLYANVAWDGFGGYLGDGDDDWVRERIADLAEVGAHYLADLLGRAWAARDRPDELRRLTDEFHDDPRDLYAFMARFARSHPESFPRGLPEGA